MGSSASKASNAAPIAKAATRHFPSANVIHERASKAAAGATKAASAREGGRVATTNSPKQDYLDQQKRLEEELARYDKELRKSGKLDGETRPAEDTPSAAELQFFGNLKTLGQVQVPNPDQIKHHEAEAILKRKLPSKSSPNTPTFAQSSPTVTTTGNAATTLTSLKLMQMLQLRNRDPSVWTEDQLAEEFDLKKQDIRALMKYVNTYTILPGKDSKGRESGVWCEDIRGVEILEKPSAVMEAEEAAAAAAAGTGTAPSSPAAGAVNASGESRSRTK
ncbi:hypothetical protein BGZ70_009163 [Mortierella alpina]|uniref:NADH dehydrogenase [ubiquinone] 1 alpha subcomplex assembly factor 4 n=1 Tax=Mortierella alpina TaxID=64518 RepID=A0A9P6J2C8_MORAP|nr:hypothetical protein BGZ70_009163 [Mortierella alpina]